MLNRALQFNAKWKICMPRLSVKIMAVTWVLQYTTLNVGLSSGLVLRWS